jgi:hypothetical protein
MEFPSWAVARLSIRLVLGRLLGRLNPCNLALDLTSYNVRNLRIVLYLKKCSKALPKAASAPSIENLASLWINKH